ncbi:MAG TPA: lanthionine synthetase LanC family protein [Acetobacteraceae bacterium]|jgi:lantibiotic biosynthesis protein|nr:lanthionine synthetase LanC family protein [Acetobacteraceae bacterium]
MSRDRDRFLAAADRIGCRLCRDAIWSDDGRCNWLGWAMELRAGQWGTTFRAASANLYDGTSGIGLFLARLACLTGDPITRATAEAALAQALAAVDSLTGRGEYGFFSGLSGIAWACREASRALRHEALAARGESALLTAARIAPNRERTDVINGSAGLIPILIEAAAGARHDEFIAAAVRHGEQLLELADRGDKGWSWDTQNMPNEPHLLGFAHGVSGIACALAALARAAGRPDFLNGAREALRYERAHFRAAEGNWPDLRNFSKPLAGSEPPCMVAWCHGAPGIGMARLYLHRLLPEEPGILAEAETAIRTTAGTLDAASMQRLANVSLCHGEGGNADLLIIAADLLNRPELRSLAEAVGMRGVDQFEDLALPWPCGVPGAGETPNLMLGLSGIGYFLLRLYDSENISSVLLPPPGVACLPASRPSAGPR